jgi:hypothetical protein
MKNVCRRRTFLKASAALGLWPLCGWAAGDRPRRVLLRSSWQTVNIGDIAHTPGMLALFEKHLPDVEVRLWPMDAGGGVEDMLRRRFPKLKIVQRKADVEAAFAECDFLLHGSGPSLVAARDVARWSETTGKPYGIGGITFQSDNPKNIQLLSNARFVYFRDSVSLQFARDHGVACPVMAFGPDAAFACDLRNDNAADAFLKGHDLQAGKFVCCIPRLRYTPYWKIRNKPMSKEDQRRTAINDAQKEHDHAPLRDAIAAIVRQTDCKVLVCPEDQSQMAIGKEMLVDPLPSDIKSRVVWREKYWLTDEAVSVYVRSAGLFGLEMHSPILCIGNGVPAVVCRFQEQTSKGLMWRDIGLADWLFDMDNPGDVSRIVPTTLAMVQSPEAAKAKAAKALAFVKQRQGDMMAALKQSLLP